jgi:hypothetical protein
MTTEETAHLEGSTSAFLHAVFYDGANYGGGDMVSNISEFPVLAAFIDQVLAADIAFAPTALVIPLGVAVSAALERLVDAGLVSPDRVLLGFPHPSGANGHRKPQFEAHKAAMTAKVTQWARATVVQESRSVDLPPPSSVAASVRFDSTSRECLHTL